MEKINVSKSIVNINVSTCSLLCSEEHADAHFLFRCCDDDDVDSIALSKSLPAITADVERNDTETEINVSRVKKIAVHKLILAAGSPIFHQMFYGQLKETKPIEIVDVSVNAFIEFLQFFYLAQPILTWANAGEVIYCGCKYQVPHVVDAYKEFLANDVLDRNNVCSILKIAIRYEFSKLIADCEKVIREYSSSVLDDIDFVRCDRVTLKYILSMENLDCHESDVFTACIKWAMEQQKLSVERKKFTSRNLKEWLGECWNLIRFPTMKIDEFTTIATDYRNYFESDEIADILGYIVHKTPMKNSSYNQG